MAVYVVKCVANYQNLCCRAEKRKIDKTLRPFVWFLPILYLLLPRLWPGSLVNRASDSGSEGRGFESLPGHGLKYFCKWRCLFLEVSPFAFYMCTNILRACLNKNCLTNLYGDFRGVNRFLGLLSYLKIAIRIGNTKRVKLPNKAIVIIQCICTVT